MTVAKWPLQSATRRRSSGQAAALNLPRAQEGSCLLFCFASRLDEGQQIENLFAAESAKRAFRHRGHNRLAPLFDSRLLNNLDFFRIIRVCKDADGFGRVLYNKSGNDSAVR
jgi:hypothetical protein